jgi:hypothetical protein
LKSAPKLKEEIERMMDSVRLEELRVFVANQRRFSVMKRLLQSGFVIFVTTLTAFSEEKPEAILAAARKLSDNQPWQVEAHVLADKIDMNISGIINGKDFDLTIDTGDQVRRQIVIGDKGWLTEKDGNTWKSWDANDRRF